MVEVDEFLEAVRNYDKTPDTDCMACQAGYRKRGRTLGPTHTCEEECKTVHDIKTVPLCDSTRAGLPAISDERLIELWLTGGTIEPGRVCTLSEVLTLVREVIVSRR